MTGYKAPTQPDPVRHVQGQEAPTSLGDAQIGTPMDGYPALTVVVPASRNLVINDSGKILESVGATGVTITVPSDDEVDFMPGTVVRLRQAADGVLSVAAAIGVTVYNAGALAGKWAEGYIRKRSANEWVFIQGVMTVTLPDAPSDGVTYARRDATWVPVPRDTGWRNISADLVNGFVVEGAGMFLIRRIDNWVIHSLESTNIDGRSSTSGVIYNYTAGFRPPANTYQAIQGDIGTPAAYRIDGFAFRLVTSGADQLNQFHRPSGAFITDEAWPTVLPGVTP